MIVKSEKYWAGLLDQYKLGSISEADRFELEKRALDDPFLFDALEGFSIEKKVSSAEKKVNTKLLTLPRMAAAASLVFLIAMIFLLKSDSRPEVENDQSIAMVLDSEENKSEIEEELSSADENLIIIEDDNEEEDIDVVEVEELKVSPSTNEKTEPPIKEQQKINSNQPDDKPASVHETNHDQVAVIKEKVTSVSLMKE